MRDDSQLLREARKSKGWTQADLASRLGLSQGYVSLLEGGRRDVPDGLRKQLTRLMDLSPVNLPLPPEPAALTGEDVAKALARLGYAGFAHLAGGRRMNPAALVVGALLSLDLDARLAEALPWVLRRHADLDWAWLVSQAKLHDLQNRLGFLVTLARRTADALGDVAAVGRLAAAERLLERSRLDRDDPLSMVRMTGAEVRWIQAHRPADAARWRVLSRLDADALLDARN